MISFELAKKLKDAGFPQAGHQFYFDTINGPEYAILFFLTEPMKSVGAPFPHDIASPTLEELIQECDNKETRTGFRELIAPKETCEGDEWGVTCGWIARYWDESNDIKAIGTTPEEVVANLWLKLKEEKKDGN